MALDEEDPTAGRQAEQDDDGAGEDNPDWRLFAKFAKTASRGGGTEAFIPKRGEKDFEPTSSHASQQASALSESRAALYSALSGGSRGHTSKDHVRCVWHRPDPASPDETMRRGHAHIEGTAKGVMFASIGRWSKERRRLELTPEETLYLVERGTIECWSEGTAGASGVPMTVQWAWSEMIGSDALNQGQYQIFAYLKRLGYVVVRKRDVDLIREQNAALQLSARSKRPAILINRLIYSQRMAVSCLLRFFCYPLAWAESWVKLPHKWLSSPDWQRRIRWLDAGAGIQRLVGGGTWQNYQTIFAALRIVPSGPATFPTRSPRRPNPYEIFFYVYKPTTKFAKASPPPPDFQLCIVDAASTLLPDAYDLTDTFEEAYQHSWASPTVIEPSAPPSGPGSWWSRLYGRLPGKPPSKMEYSRNRPNVYGKLKTGTRNFLMGVVDNGVTTFLRFTETDFGALPAST